MSSRCIYGQISQNTKYKSPESAGLKLFEVRIGSDLPTSTIVHTPKVFVTLFSASINLRCLSTPSLPTQSTCGDFKTPEVLIHLYRTDLIDCII